ncbi:LCP family protein [Lysobacter korlensis]|uniref:LCP family protein n=1 Tax=Lysobacter korlensis TaxID=553636 RepID=A0ABV6RT40_9GAMM
MSDLRPRSSRSRLTGIARHGRLRRSSPWLAGLKLLSGVLAVALVSGVAVAAITLKQLQDGIVIASIPQDTAPPPDIAAMPGGFNILITGSDTREGQGGLGGTHEDGVLNDVNILLHVSEDHSNAVAVSIPRDLIVATPECPNQVTGEIMPAQWAAPINSVLDEGGLYCVVKTVSELTGLDIQFAGMITFRGVVEMSNAVGGVPVCISAPIHDPQAGLEIAEAGTHTLAGEEALAFLRSRHGVGDGSDLGRISSQQVYMSSLVRTLKSADTLGDLSKVYQLARAATSNMTLSENFAQLDTLAAIALALKDVPMQNVVFVQYPVADGTSGPYLGKLQPVSEQADALFARIAADEPFVLDEDRLRTGAVADPNAPAEPPAEETPAEETPAEEAPAEEAPVEADGGGTAEPAGGQPQVLSGLKGQTAADYTCSEAN